MDNEKLYTAMQTCRATGATIAKLNHVAKIGLCPPTLRVGEGAASRPLYKRRKIIALYCICALRPADLADLTKLVQCIERDDLDLDPSALHWESQIRLLVDNDGQTRLIYTDGKGLYTDERGVPIPAPKNPSLGRGAFTVHEVFLLDVAHALEKRLIGEEKQEIAQEIEALQKQGTEEPAAEAA